MQIVNFYNNPNIGIFFYTTDKFTIIPTITPENIKKELKTELKTELVETNIYNSSAVSIFLAGDEKVLFAPNIINKDERKILEKIKGIKLVILDTKLNALGNNIIINKNTAFVNPNFEDKTVKMIEENGYKVVKGRIGGVDTVGANIVKFGDKALITPDATNDEIKILNKELRLECEKGMINNSKIVKSGVIVNRNGMLISNYAMGSEMLLLEELWRNGY